MTGTPPSGADLPCCGVFNIPAGNSFLDDLVAGIVARWGSTPESLSTLTILLPNRRACRALRDAFLRHAGESGTLSLLLPRMSPIGDIDPDALGIAADDLPAVAAAMDQAPPIDPMRRRLLLSRLIMTFDKTISADRAVWLADELARLLDQVATEQVAFSGLEALAPSDLAGHWQTILDFLKIVTSAWPAVLEDEGVVDAATRRNTVLAAQAEAWRSAPPDHPVIVAGSTGSIPATATLMQVVAGLPLGCVVLPGLDETMTPDSWDALDETHPQFGLRSLLARLDCGREAVRPWLPPAQTEAAGGSPGHRSQKAAARRRLASEIMRPAETTDRWRAPEGLTASALDGLVRIDVESPREEADVIALAMREQLEEPDRTVALVTPDRALARRVTAVLTRWDIIVDDSGGRPLRESPVGAFLQLLAEAAESRCQPARLLSVLKHPLAALGQPRSRVRQLVEKLETGILRGPAPAPGLAGLRRAVEGATDTPHRDDILQLIDQLIVCADGFLDGCAGGGSDGGEGPAPHMRAGTLAPVDIVRRHIACAEAMASTDEKAGADILWRGEDGEAAALVVRSILDHANDHPSVSLERYAAFFDALVGETPVRPRYGTHPRLAILGPLEARLTRADLVILGGLNEGAWPADPAVDPWMSRPMRRAFGLAAVERRIGLSAHDFVESFCAPTVMLTRSLRVDGAPTVPSRWLLRFDAVLKGAGLSFPHGVYHRHLARLRHEPGGYFPVSDPRPRPALSLRPDTVRVSEVGMWINDPYAFYAKHVLRLVPLAALSENPGAAERGTVIHQALADYVRQYGLAAGPDAAAVLDACGRRAFQAYMSYPAVRAFWWPRFERVARWFLSYLAGIDAGNKPGDPSARAAIVVEDDGRLLVPRPISKPLMLRARADRIDRMDGGLVIVDYKTGAAPSKKAMLAGLAPQLPLEGVIAEAGGFRFLKDQPQVQPQDQPEGVEVCGLEHWIITGGREPGKVDAMAVKDIAPAVSSAREGIERLAGNYDNETMPYLSRPRGAVRHTDDYVYLARVAEWANDQTGTEGEP